MKDTTAKTIGTVTFALGIAILVTVFFIVCRIFLNDGALEAAINTTKEPLADSLLRWASDAAARLIMLVFMTVSGAIITDRGLKFYFAYTETKPPVKRSGKQPDMNSD